MAYLQTLIDWFDTEAAARHLPSDPARADRVDWLRCVPFLFLHGACVALIWVGWSPVAVAVCLASFWLRMFAVTAFYHRYFSHRAYKTNRFWQFLFAVLGNTAAQRGPLWWASHHRQHHKHADSVEDLHSPVTRGFWHSHVLWFMTPRGFATNHAVIKDWARYPELRFLNRFDNLVPLLYAGLMYGLGEWIALRWPESGTSGWQMLVWGFLVSTVLLFHSTFTINSLGHVWGSRRFRTRDQSRNNFWLALLTLGEGWHNNHHRFAVSARQGFYWWELDISWLILKFLSWFGIVHALNPVPSHILKEGRGLDEGRRRTASEENLS